MAVMLGLLLISRLCLSQSSPSFDDMEGARYLETQASNTVPMIGKKAADRARAERPPSHFDYLLRFLDMGLRGRQSPILGKRSTTVMYPTWFRKDLARLGKRGYPSFSIPESWTKTKPRASLSNLRNMIYSEAVRDKRNSLPSTDQWSDSWYPRKETSWFRYHDGDNGALGSLMYKRAEDQHTKDFNSVPFIGKRAEVSDGVGQRPADEDDVLVRKPREEEEEGGDPWQYFQIKYKLQNGLMM